MYVTGVRMHLILNGEPLEGVDCFKYQGSQVAAEKEYRMARRVLMAEVSGGNERDRGQAGWMV